MQNNFFEGKENYTWKVTNVEMYCDIRIDVNTLYIYIYMAEIYICIYKLYIYNKKYIYNNSSFVVMI